MQNIVAAGRMTHLLLFLPPGRKRRGERERQHLDAVGQHRPLPGGDAVRTGDAVRWMSATCCWCSSPPMAALRVYRSQGDMTQGLRPGRLARHLFGSDRGSGARGPLARRRHRLL